MMHFIFTRIDVIFVFCAQPSRIALVKIHVVLNLPTVIENGLLVQSTQFVVHMYDHDLSRSPTYIFYHVNHMDHVFDHGRHV